MAGTKAGGIKAAATNKDRHGEDFYKKIGTKGGQNGNTGGFATRIVCYCDVLPDTHYLSNCAGVKGGRISVRPPSGKGPRSHADTY